MSKLHAKTGRKCICCDEDTTKYVTLHKTRRQTHRLCDACADGYIRPLVKQTTSNIKKKINSKFFSKKNNKTIFLFYKINSNKKKNKEKKNIKHKKDKNSKHKKDKNSKHK